jgi:soluble lytic murein transglycosylase
MFKPLISLLLVLGLLFSSPVQARGKNGKKTKKTAKIGFGTYNNLQNQIAETSQQGLFKILKTTSEDFQIAVREFSKIVSALQKNRPTDALAISPESTGIFAEYAHFSHAQALMSLGRYDEAVSAIPLRTLPISKISWDAYWLRLEALVLSGKTAQFETEMTPLLKRLGTDKGAKIKTAYLRGAAALMNGNRALAAKHFLVNLVENAGTEYDARIFDLLRHKSISVNAIMNEALWNMRAEKLIANGYPHEARKIWERFYQNTNGAVKASYRERVAYGTFRERNYEKAAALYSSLWNDKAYSTPEVAVLEKITQSYARYDNFDGAIRANKMLQERFPGSRAAIEAEFKLGFLYFDSGHFKEAITYFERFLNRGTAKQKTDARWYRLWGFFLTKDYAKAKTEMAALAKISKDKKILTLLDYWTARATAAQGDKNTANQMYQKIADAEPYSYYGLLSRQRLHSGKLLPKTLIDPKLMTHLPSGLASIPALPKVSGIPEGDALLKAIVLAALGFDSFAYAETLTSSMGTSGDQALINYQNGANYNIPFANVAGLMNRRGLDETTYTFGYPRAFAKYISPFSHLWGLDQNLAYAIMRQESAFKPEAQSFAYAYGLMQIIPPTGEEIADAIGFSGFHASLLNKPHINTLFGTYYLNYLMGKFNGNPVYAMAGYNAGPLAVSRWVRKSEDQEPDVFIELIPYAETNTYTKKVLVNYLAYSKIYKSESAH